MSYLLNVIRIPIILIWTAICAVLAFMILLFTFSTDRVLKIVPNILWSPFVFAVSGSRLLVKGKENIVRDSYNIYVSNHCSQFDIPATVGAIDIPLYFMLKKELKKVPFLGWYAAALGMVFVDRKNRKEAQKNIIQAGELIRNGKNVLVYPEGTRSEDGEVRLFRKGAFNIAKQAKVGIVPFAIEGTQALLPKGGFVLRPARVMVNIGPVVTYEEMKDMDEIAMADHLKNKVIELKEEAKYLLKK